MVTGERGGQQREGCADAQAGPPGLPAEGEATLGVQKSSGGRTDFQSPACCEWSFILD